MSGNEVGLTISKKNLVGALGLVAGAVSALVFATTIFSSFPDSDNATSDQQNELRRASFIQVQKDVESLKGRMDAITSAEVKPDGKDSPLLAKQLQLLRADLNEVQKKQEQISQTIMDSPERALEIPLLKKEIDGVRDDQSNKIQSLKESIDRIYDVNKWLVGGMAVAVLSLCLSNYFKPRTRN